MFNLRNKAHIHFFFLANHNYRHLKDKDEAKRKQQQYDEENSQSLKIINRVKEIYKYMLSLNNIQRLEYLSNKRIVKEFKGAHHYSTSVYLLEDYIVRKNLKRNSLGYFLFMNEINALLKLQPYDFFPKIIGFNIKHLSIYMTYCGEQLTANNIPFDWEEQINEIKKILLKIKVNSNDMIIRNVCVLNKRIYIIDFGLSSQYGISIEQSINSLKRDLKRICLKK